MNRSSRGRCPRSDLWAAALGGFLALALAGSVQAQTFDSVGEGLIAGHFILHPSMFYGYTYDNNVLFMSTDLPGSDPIASGTNVLGARILADLPIDDNRIRMAYAPFYRGYTSDHFQPEDRLNHVFDIEGLFHTGHAITLAFRDHYVNGTVSLQEQVERNGSSVGLGHYTTHDPQLEIGVSVGERQGFSLVPGYSHSSYTGLSTAVGQIADYTYTTRRIEGRYNYKLSEPTTFFGYTALDRTLQTRTGVSDVTIQSRSIGLGLIRTANQNIVTNLSAGYQTLDFEGGVGQNYQGPTIEGNVTWQVADLTQIDVGFLRKPFPSTSIYISGGREFVASNYYIATEGRIHWIRQIGRNTFMDASALLQDNQYVPLTGVGRRERLTRLEVGTGHQFMKNLRGYAGLNFERRDSNVLQLSGGVGADPFQYELYRILFRLEVGWL